VSGAPKLTDFGLARLRGVEERESMVTAITGDHASTSNDDIFP
jgi:hypothetical protein